jgi:hypothetical protein
VGKGTRERTEVHTTFKSAKQTMGRSPKRRNQVIWDLNPSLVKQVMKGDGQKTWKNTKLGRSFSYCCNYTSQDSGGLSILKNQKHSLLLN